MKRLVLPLLTGLCLAASALLASRVFFTPTAVAPAPAPPPNLAWSWRDQPGRLSADYAASAISAWSQLRAPDGSPVDNATRGVALRALLLRLPSTAYPRLIAALSIKRKIPAINVTIVRSPDIGVIGVGEGIDDLQDFDARTFVDALFVDD